MARDGSSQEIPPSAKIDTDQLSCPHCGSKLRLALVSADMVSEMANHGGGTLLLETIEKRVILTAMREAGNDKRLAARMLGIGKTTLYRKLKEYGFEAPPTDIVSSPKTPRISSNALPKTTKTIGTVIEPKNHLHPFLADIEKQAILTALRETENDRQLVAQMLGIGRPTLYRRLKEYGIPLAHCPRSKATTA